MVSDMSRPQVNFEQIPARFPEGTKARIQAVLEEKEPAAEFIRVAVEKELRRREKKG